MLNNPIVNSLMKKIKSNNSMQDYYKKKSGEFTFIRDHIVYENTADWSIYWLKLAEYWGNQNRQIYELIRYIEKNKIGSKPFPERPSKRVLIKQLY